MNGYDWQCQACDHVVQVRAPCVPCKCECCGVHERMERIQPTFLESVVTSAKFGRHIPCAEMQEIFDHHRKTGELRVGGVVYSEKD